MPIASGLTSTRIPVHPQPLPDELLTHWFLRLAHSNQLKVQTFADYTFGRYSSFWARDQDKLASPAVISKLAELTGLGAEKIRSLTLATYEGNLYRDHNPFGNTRWILPLGVYHRTRRLYGIQYCPLCLAEDPVPYFRRRWRLAFSTICDKHGTMMHDRCYRCGAPVAYFRSDLGHRKRHNFGPSTTCDQCGADLVRAPAYDAPGPDGQTLLMLRSLALGADIGWWWVDSKLLGYAHLFFDVLHHLAVRMTYGAGLRLLSEVERQTGRVVVCGRKPDRGMLEVRPLMQRHDLVLAALWLLQEWPTRFVETCRQARLWQSWLLCGRQFPWWFEQAVKSSLDQAIYEPNIEEAQHAAEYLTRQGKRASTQAVARLLGGRDHLAARQFAGGKHKPP